LMIRKRLFQEGRLEGHASSEPGHQPRALPRRCIAMIRRMPEAQWPLAGQPHGCVYEFAPTPYIGVARLRALPRVTALSLTSTTGWRSVKEPSARVTLARPFADPDIQRPTRRCRIFHDRRSFVEMSAEGPPGHVASVKSLILERAGGIVDHQGGTCRSGPALRLSDRSGGSAIN
jgi:hypothetical protein